MTLTKHLGRDLQLRGKAAACATFVGQNAKCDLPRRRDLPEDSRNDPTRSQESDLLFSGKGPIPIKTVTASIT
eukprot:700051-Amphidinium_carterae.1